MSALGENKTTLNSKPTTKLNFFDYVFEIIGWLQIVASPFLLGFIIGLFIYLSNPGALRLVIGITVATLGLITGMIIATKAWKKKGTMHFMSRVMASPELDILEDKKE